MSYECIPVDGNKGKRKGGQPQAPTATSDPITTVPAQQHKPAKQPTATTATTVAVEDYHNINSAVADNETWKKTTGSMVIFDKNGVKAKKSSHKGHPGYPGKKEKKPKNFGL